MFVTWTLFIFSNYTLLGVPRKQSGGRKAKGKPWFKYGRHQNDYGGCNYKWLVFSSKYNHIEIKTKVGSNLANPTANPSEIGLFHCFKEDILFLPPLMCLFNKYIVTNWSVTLNWYFITVKQIYYKTIFVLSVNSCTYLWKPKLKN